MPQEPRERYEEGFWYKDLQHLAQWWDSLWGKVVIPTSMGFPGSPVVKSILANAEDIMRPRFDPWVEKIPWRRVRQPTSYLQSGKFHGQRSLGGNSPWGCKRVRHNWACTHTHPHTHTPTHTHTQYRDEQNPCKTDSLCLEMSYFLWTKIANLSDM